MAATSYALTTPSTWMVTIKPNSKLTIKLLKTYVKSVFYIQNSDIEDFPENTIVFKLSYLTKENNLKSKFESGILNEVNIRKYNSEIEVGEYSELIEFLNGANKNKKRNRVEETLQVTTDSEDEFTSTPPPAPKKLKFTSAKRSK